MKWFYQDNSSEIGPLSETALRELHQCGTFSSTALIRREDSEDWGTFEDLLASTPDTPDFPAKTVEPELRKFYCIHCGQRISADSSQVGMMATCPSCSGEVLIPGEHVQPMAVVTVAPSRAKGTDAVARRAKGLLANLDASSLAFSFRSAAPFFIVCLGFGWIATWLLPLRAFSPELTPASLIGVVALAVPAVTITLFGMIRFLGYPRRNWIQLIAALLFTMIFGVSVLLLFYQIAESYQNIQLRSYGKATPIVLGIRFIGWAGQYHGSEGFFTRLFASIIHTGFCEEVSKLLPLFLIVILGRNQAKIPQLRGFLMIAFFSGLGFGIAEAVKVYSPWSGNIGLPSNVIRWYACVPLHAIYAVIDATFLWLLIPSFRNATSWLGKSGILVAAAIGVAIVHGVYNTCAEIHPLAGLIFDGIAIAIMIKLVRYCVARESSDEGAADAHNVHKLSLPKWLSTRKDGQPAFGRMYGTAGLLAFASLLLSSPMTGFSRSFPPSFASEVKANFGIELDVEAAFAYAMGYTIGSTANRPVSPGAFERLVSEAFAMNPGANPAAAQLMLLGMDDGYNYRPSRLEGETLVASISQEEINESIDATHEGYRINQADRQVLKEFEGIYEVAITYGKRTGKNGLVILLGAVESMNWNAASSELRSAVNEVKSIQSGESPDSRNSKLKKFTEIWDMY